MSLLRTEKEFTNPAHRYSFDLDLFGKALFVSGLEPYLHFIRKGKNWQNGYKNQSGDKGRR